MVPVEAWNASMCVRQDDQPREFAIYTALANKFQGLSASMAPLPVSSPSTYPPLDLMLLLLV